MAGEIARGIVGGFIGIVFLIRLISSSQSDGDYSIDNKKQKQSEVKPKHINNAIKIQKPITVMGLIQALAFIIGLFIVINIFSII